MAHHKFLREVNIKRLKINAVFNQCGEDRVIELTPPIGKRVHLNALVGGKELGRFRGGGCLHLGTHGGATGEGEEEQCNGNGVFH